MRLDHYLSSAGLGSRSDVKKIIAKGRITVAGTVIKDPAFKVNADEVCLDGIPVIYEEHVYFMLNKPQGVISASRADLRNKDEKCVIDLIQEEKHRDLFPVGRLDKDTEGLLLITDDGQLAHDLLSPKKHVYKTYYAELAIKIEDDDISRIEKGIDIGDDKPTLPCKIKKESDTSVYITIHEGRFHQVKRMFESVGNKVVFLKRISMGNLTLDPELAPGEYKKLRLSDCL